MVKQIGIGLLSGLAGTAALTAVAQIERKALPWGQKNNALFPHKVVKTAENYLGIRSWLSGGQQTAAIHAANFAYGTAMGTLYGWSAPKLKMSPLISGPLFGLGLWAIGLSGSVPAFGAEHPPWKKSPMQVVMPILSHLAYGLAAGAIVQACQKKERFFKRKRLFSI